MTETQTAPIQTLTLQPPEEIAPVAAPDTKGLVQLSAESKKKADAQLEAFMAALLTENLNSDAFRTRLDTAFSLGRKEIADATTLSNAFTKQNFAGNMDTPAYQAISQMRELFDDLNPATQGDLFTPTKFLGIPVPFANKLQRYLRRYESAEGQMGKLQEQVVQAKDVVSRGVAELGTVRQKLWGSLDKLEAAVYFITELDTRLSGQIETLTLTEPDRARALSQEVLYYVRQNVGDLQATQALVINAYNVAGELRKTGREVMNGCDRVSTLGMAALSIAVTLAQATGVQIKTMEMVSGAKKSIEGLITSTGQALNAHVQETVKFASEPVLGVQALQQMFDATFQAMDTMDSFRANALNTMKTNNDMLRSQLTTQMQRISNDRQAAGAADAITF